MSSRIRHLPCCNLIGQNVTTMVQITLDPSMLFPILLHVCAYNYNCTLLYMCMYMYMYMYLWEDFCLLFHLNARLLFHMSHRTTSKTMSITMTANTAMQGPTIAPTFIVALVAVPSGDNTVETLIKENYIIQWSSTIVLHGYTVSQIGLQYQWAIYGNTLCV